MGYVRTATTGDVIALAPRLRAEDVAEVQAAGGLSPLRALANGFNLSKPCLTLVGDEGEVCGMMGVTPTTLPELGVVWLLASDDLLKYRVQFLRECRGWIDAFNDQYPVLFNYTDARNKIHHRWLDWCGFTFIKRHPEYGIERRPFIEFLRIK